MSTTFRKITKFLYLASAAALPAAKSDTSSIEWGPCNQTEVNTTGTAPAQCGTLPVPLDYTDTSSDKTLDLQLVNIPATIEPCKGSIQFNLGGPGATTRQDLATFGYSFLNLTGGQYNIVGFDPRGTGNTLPFSCVVTELEAQMLLQRFTQGGNASDTALDTTWAGADLTAAMCKRNGNDTGSLIGTALTARDLISVVDALGEDGMLRFWGLSYGTTLGATVASMFPDRIDKIILDGVQNPHEYYHALADFEEWTQTDYVFSSIFTSCVEAGPETCLLASLNKTATELENMYWNFLYDLKYNPIPIEDADTIVDYATVKSFVINLLYSIDGWPAFTDILLAIFTAKSEKDVATALSSMILAGGSSSSTSTSLVEQTIGLSSWAGIHCGDRFPRTENISDTLDVYHELTNISHTFGDVLITREMTCARWEFEAKERYSGNFTANLPNSPMLLIGNTGDAFTPIKSAYNVSSGFEGSGVLEIEGFGHASLSVPSSCTLEHVSNYWKDGILPEKGTRCEVEAKPWGNVTWADIFSKKAKTGTE
ncbi:putative hydrolase [Pseudocercospora fuligena]|uniref:Putative hydrolase n=1 Tax=Pseudocercospora fuligena TaxID=685502 RepID=A0A8H6RVN8_9PEZI|nr:putative hydrolase [Pseudocercospora fuligena]